MQQSFFFKNLPFFLSVKEQEPGRRSAETDDITVNKCQL